MSLPTIRKLLAERNFSSAIDACDRAIAETPEDAELHFLRAVALAEADSVAEAERGIRNAIALREEAPWTWELVLINILRDRGAFDAACAAADALLVRVPDRPEIHNALGLTLQAMGDNAAARHAFKRALELSPRYVAARTNLAALLCSLGHFDDAIASLRQGSELVPAEHEFHVGLGRAYEAFGNLSEARSAYSTAIRANPDSFEALWRLGRLAQREFDLFSAITAFEAALRLRPDDVELWIWIGNAYLDVGASGQATRCFREALNLKPDYAEVYDNLLVSIHYTDKADADVLFEAHLEWARRFALPSCGRRAVPVGTNGRRLRIAFVSRSMHAQVMRAFLAPLAAHLDRDIFETFAFSIDASSLPQETPELATVFDQWHELRATSDEELVTSIRNANVDVLVDLDGHVPGNRLRALTRRPAPVQVTWLDYFDTTGTAAFDVLIGDSVAVPETGSQRFTERIARLDPSRLCYAAPPNVPDVSEPPALANGFVTFGSFNRLSKIGEPLLDLWASLLKSVPDSRLVLKNGAFAHATTRQVFLQRFGVRGIVADRVNLRPASDHFAMLKEYSDVDVALDTFPYNGGLTTCEALYMGLPIAALRGQSMISGQSAALLVAAGFPQWIAETPDEWLSLNMAFASDLDGLRNWRLQARRVLESSPLMDGHAFARKFEAIVLDCIRRVNAMSEA